MARTIRRHLTRADRTRDPYAYVPFEVPEGTTRIDVTLSYPKANDCVIDLGCADPRLGSFPSEEGFRGWSGGARDRFFIATDDATPGYVHGEIPAGEWNVMLGLYKVPDSGTDVDVTVELDDSPRKVAPQPKRTMPVRKGAGWYKGDLHCHTFHSDAQGSPEVLHASARQAGLDFLAIADHNTTTQRRYFHPQSSPDLVFVRAMEVTTAEGHCNVFGVDDWIDFRMTRASDVHTLARIVHEKGGLLSINHDKPPIPWTYDWPDADCMEVYHETWMHLNWVTLERYQQRLASGMRLSAIGGSDYHQPAELQAEGPLGLGRPTTMLWLDELSEDAILEAMKAGRGYMTESPRGPHLSLHAGDVHMGGDLPADARAVQVNVRGGQGDLLVWIDANGPVGQQIVPDSEWRSEIVLAERPAKFIRAELVAKASRDAIISELIEALPGKKRPDAISRQELDAQPIRRALTNPIYTD